MVQGSRQTRNLPLGLRTKTRLWHQSVALFVSSFLITPSVIILSISCFSGSTIACGIFLGGWITGVILSSSFNFTIASLIVPTPSNSSGNNSITWPCNLVLIWYVYQLVANIPDSASVLDVKTSRKFIQDIHCDLFTSTIVVTDDLH